MLSLRNVGRVLAISVSIIASSDASASDRYVWSSDANQCDASKIDIGSDSRPKLIFAASSNISEWQTFEIDAYESSCEVDVNYVDPNGEFISGLATCYSEGDEALVDLRVDKKADGILLVDFRNQFEDYTIHSCN